MENAKSSQLLRVFLEVPGGLPRDNRFTTYYVFGQSIKMTNPESDFGLVFFDAYDRTVFVSIVMCTVSDTIYTLLNRRVDIYELHWAIAIVFSKMKCS